MDKDYEIIQNISLAEKKEQVAPEAAPEVTVTPPGEEVASSPVIEIPAIATPEVAIQVPEQAVPAVAVPEVKLEIPGMDVPAVEEPVTVEPTYEEPVVVAEEPTPEYSYGDNTSDDEYKSMFTNTDVEVPAYNNYNDSYENSYNSAPSYTAESVVSVDINFKDENSINNYYDQKREASINEIEKERAAALDQCKKYQEMANWVNDIGSSFNFFKGRSGY